MTKKLKTITFGLCLLVLTVLCSLYASAYSYKTSYSYNMEIPNYYHGYSHPQYPVASGNKYYYNSDYHFERNKYKEGYYRTFQFEQPTISRNQHSYSRGFSQEVFIKRPSLDSYDLKSQHYNSYPQRYYHQVPGNEPCFPKGLSQSVSASFLFRG